MPADDAAAAAIDALLRELNACWTLSRAPETERFLHDDVVFTGSAPGVGEVRIEGKAACVQSYVDFANACMIIAFEQAPARVDIAGDTAVAVYDWRLEYVWAGLTSSDSGRDLLVLHRVEGQWLVTWRLNPLPTVS
jgi:ketosteroid isomerase-like protein